MEAEIGVMSSQARKVSSHQEVEEMRNESFPKTRARRACDTLIFDPVTLISHFWPPRL